MTAPTAPITTAPPAPIPNARRLLWAGFFSIFAAGVGFSVRAGILVAWALDYGFTKSELGAISGGGLTGFGVVILFGSLLADWLGYGKLMIFAFVMHVLSAVLQLSTDFFFTQWGADGVFWCLYVAMFLFAIANGTCEAVVNPMVASLFPKQKTHYLNILHAGWPGGLIAGGLLSYFMNGGTIAGWMPLGKVHWTIQMCMFLVPTAIYGLLVLGQRFPRSEAKEAGLSYNTMLAQFAHPLLWMLLLIHALVGYVELGTDSWIPQITGAIMANPTYGLLLFVYTSGLMFALRFFGGPLEHRFSPLGLLCMSGVLGFLGLFLLSSATTILFCVIAATVYALGKTFLWPTMLAIVSERFPKGGALTIGAVGGMGMLSAGFLGAPMIGYKQDHFASQELDKASHETFQRYEAKSGAGLDGSKKGLLELEAKANDVRKDLEKVTKEGDAKKAEDAKEQLREIEHELTLTLKREDEHAKKLQAQGKTDVFNLATWWKEEGRPNLDKDKEPVEKSNLYGGQMAMRLTAFVPLTMALLYLLLILYFRSKGGYTKVEIGKDEEPARFLGEG
jgi:MFS family permease